MEDDVKAEFEKLKKEIEDLKKRDARKERLFVKLSKQFNNHIKQFKVYKNATRSNGNSIETIKNVLRNMSR